jgi:hypothetical protein
MDATDRKEFDRVYNRLAGQWSKSDRQVDTDSLAKLQALMDRVREEEFTEHDTDRMPPDTYPTPA